MLYIAGIVLGLVAGFALGGRLGRLGENVRLPWIWVLYSALGVQLAMAFRHPSWLTTDVQFATLLVSYAMLVAWVGVAAASHRNVWIRMALVAVAVGTGLNFIVIAANRGMPVSRDALRSADIAAPSGEANRFSVKHVVAGANTILNPLGDVIPIYPLRDVVSIGDLLVGLGIASVIAAGMKVRAAAAPASATPADSPQPPERKPLMTGGAVRGGFLDREISVKDFVAQFAGGYAVGKGNEQMDDNVRYPSESSVVLSQAMSITDANLAGNVHGGVVMKLVDTAAGLSAIKHAHGRVVTVSMDEMSFLEPVFLTDLVTLRAQVNDVGRTSMEVGVRVEAENTLTGERRHVSSAYLVFVALDQDGKPRPVPRLEPQSEEERRRMEDAKIRRRHRIARKEALMARRGDGAQAVSSSETAIEQAVPEPAPETLPEPETSPAGEVPASAAATLPDEPAPSTNGGSPAQWDEWRKTTPPQSAG